MTRRAVAARETFRYGPVTAVRYGRVVTVHLPEGSMIPGAKPSAATTPAKLPDGWRPVAQVSATRVGNTGDFLGNVFVTPSGDVSVYVSRVGVTATGGGFTLNASLSITYVC